MEKSIKTCNEILSLMKKAGYEAVETCEGWTADDIDYFLANYQKPYLGTEYNGLGK